MLNYLREIRNRLLKKGDLRKYLFYAIGEIIIVVAGILLALYLNNWNQERTDKKLEVQYYQNIKNQLNEDLDIINGEIYYNQSFLDQFYYARNIILQNNKDKIDTLGRISLKMIRFSDFRRKSNIYQTLINSGEIIKINNYVITERLQSLEETYTYINRLEDNHLSIILSEIIPDIKQRFQFDPMIIESSGSLFNHQFLNDYIILITIMSEKSEIYNRAKDEIHSIIGLIDQELED